MVMQSAELHTRLEDVKGYNIKLTDNGLVKGFCARFGGFWRLPMKTSPPSSLTFLRFTSLNIPHDKGAQKAPDGLYVFCG